MKLCLCPECHAHITLTALVQDESARDLIGIMLKLDSRTARCLSEYLALFRPAKKYLSNARAATLAEEVLELQKAKGLSDDMLYAALRDSVETAKKKGEQFKQPKDHGWLKSFMDDAIKAQNAPHLNLNPKRRHQEKKISQIMTRVMMLRKWLKHRRLNANSWLIKIS